MAKKNVEIEGFDELHDLLMRMGKAAGDAAREATEAGAKIIEDAAQARAPRPGVIDIELVESKPHRSIFNIGLKKDFWYLRYFESGAQPHEINGSPHIFDGDA